MNEINELKLELFWSDIPIGKQNAVTYPELMKMWGKSERSVRAILHDLSLMDNGDDYILVRSASGKGFYRTDDGSTIRAYKKECLNKGKSIFAPVKKINRVLKENTTQREIENNLRLEREAHGLKQSEVCKQMKKYDSQFDKSLLSKMENGVCLPTPFQLSKLAEIYGCKPSEIVNIDLF